MLDSTSTIDDSYEDGTLDGNTTNIVYTSILCMDQAW